MTARALLGACCSFFMHALPFVAHAQAPMPDIRLHWGAQAIGMVSHVSPAIGGHSLMEGYLTQPTLMGGVNVRSHLSGQLTISLEGLTLDRGELGPGTYGEGYIDRRHPHTYLHEAVVSGFASLPVVGDASLTVGRGFAPFGTDDPMMRPLVRFPVNHHLSQVLERLLVIAAVRRGPLMLEWSTFSGNEPLSPRDLGDVDRFGDSWSARLTLRPSPAWELQTSRAQVNSPEEPTGFGNDQRKWSASARHESSHGMTHLYALGEWSRTTTVGTRGDATAVSSALAEASVTRMAWSGALRLERTERAEEARNGESEFRTAWPPYDHLFLGVSRWNVATVHAERALRVRGIGMRPFVEASVARVGIRDKGLFEPREWYGGTTLTSVSAGVRLDVGMRHARMGRYGVAAAPAPMAMADGEHMHH